MARRVPSPASAKADPAAELARFLKANPGLLHVDAFLPDMNGNPRGKRFPAHEAAKIWTGGVQLPFCLYFLDATGEDLDPGGRSELRGDPDGNAWPVAGTLVPVPWAPEPTAQVLLTMPEQANQPCLVDPRQVLAGLAARFARRGLTPVVAVEMEFYLMDRKRGTMGEPLPPISPATGEPDNSRQLYSIAGLDIYADFVRDVAAAAKAQNIPASTAIAENSPGQFEINLTHCADPVAAGDHAVLLRRIIKSVAPRHGFAATFMAKPFLDKAGSGMHVHCSLIDAKGRNVFDDGGEGGTALLRHAIGGLVATTPEAMALLAPNLNSYRRYRPGSLVPMAPSWGYNNRSVAFRVPTGAPKARRVEHRIAGADANPHLAVAAILAGMLHGIERKLDPGKPATTDVSAKIDRNTPFRWHEAIDRLRKAKILPAYVDAGYLSLYADAKEAELNKFNATISPQEHAWYL
ncbi:MAG TPA: glutamine synthetase family protein [Alphaproteobacteria bacterium]|nr:glutamine synthetase family protein [Alphaproteobacteria bacterium]